MEKNPTSIQDVEKVYYWFWMLTATNLRLVLLLKRFEDLIPLLMEKTSTLLLRVMDFS